MLIPLVGCSTEQVDVKGGDAAGRKPNGRTTINASGCEHSAVGEHRCAAEGADGGYDPRHSRVRHQRNGAAGVRVRPLLALLVVRILTSGAAGTTLWCLASVVVYGNAAGRVARVSKWT
jgi:hypothetical protein